jgi:transposase
MAQVRSWPGLDVHAAKVLAATIDSQSGELVVRRLPGEASAVVEFCAELPGPTRVAYEAGPTGFGLAPALESAGVGCLVAAPGEDRAAGERSRQDRPA